MIETTSKNYSVYYPYKLQSINFTYHTVELRKIKASRHIYITAALNNRSFARMYVWLTEYLGRIQLLKSK